MKQEGKTGNLDFVNPKFGFTKSKIEMPKNTPVGLFVAGGSLLFGFGLIWHMWWLAALGIVGCIALLIVRSFDKETEII
jgi:cytochrome o ubiquinol oxidase subunit 1